MGADDNETKASGEGRGERNAEGPGDGGDAGSGSAPPDPTPARPVPPKVLAALARAREAAKADRASKGGRILALFPAVVAVVFLLLMMPRETLPDTVPLPIANVRTLRAIAAGDDARAREAEANRLPADVVLVGTALRHLSGSEAHGADELERIDARRQLDSAMRDLGSRGTVAAELETLRAVQGRRYLDALATWERSGEATEDFEDLAASFVVRAEAAGWVHGRTIIADETERRVMFKTYWNVLAGVDTRPDLALTLDEQRALYAFYIKHPHPPESNRAALDAERRGAKTPEACTAVNQEAARASALWLADKIKRLGAIDATYPTAYALGVAYYQAGRVELATDAFASFIEAHPSGTHTLRARNHLKGLLAATSSR